MVLAADGMPSADSGAQAGLNGDPQYGGGQVVFAVESGLAVPGSYSGLLNHYSTVRVLQHGLGVNSTYINNAATAGPIDIIWAH
jgi:hypothetical protein